MKDIKLVVTVKYLVEVAQTVSDEVFESLKYMSKDFGPVEEIDRAKFDVGAKFLCENISERDRCYRAYEIDTLEEIKDDGQD